MRCDNYFSAKLGGYWLNKIVLLHIFVVLFFCAFFLYIVFSWVIKGGEIILKGETRSSLISLKIQ